MAYTATCPWGSTPQAHDCISHRALPSMLYLLQILCTCHSWCSVLGDLIIPIDSLSISLGMGLSVTLKAGVEQLRWLWGAVAQQLEHLQLTLVRFPAAALGFSSTAGLLMLMA